jgi:opacity protein-like surface antigen
VFGEYSYVPLAGFSGSVAGSGGVVAGDVSSKLMDFSGGVHVNLAPGRAVPYLLGAIGVGRLSAKGSATVGTTTASFDGSDTSLGASTGLGLRYFVGHNWGIQPEFRYTRYFFDGAGLNDFRFAGGLFFRFGE